MHSSSRISPQLPRRGPNLQRRQRTALSATGEGTPLRVAPRPSNGPKASIDLHQLALPHSYPANKLASDRHKGQPLCPNASKAKDKVRSTGSFNPR